jgi:hypothetical protein
MTWYTIEKWIDNHFVAILICVLAVIESIALALKNFWA